MIKIVILFVSVTLLLLGGWYMYKSLDYKKETFSENIYNYVSPQATEVFNVNKDYNIDDILTYNPALSDLTQTVNDYLTPPILITKNKDNSYILTAKAKYEHYSDILDYIERHIALPYPAKQTQYKDVDIFSYTMQDEGFLCVTLYKGIFAVSRSYKTICTFIDSDPENTFFNDNVNRSRMEKICINSPVSIFIKDEKNIFALDYKLQNDTINLSGYMLDIPSSISDTTQTDNRYAPYLINFPENTCIDSISVESNNPPSVKIILNKMH